MDEVLQWNPDSRERAIFERLNKDGTSAGAGMAERAASIRGAVGAPTTRQVNVAGKLRTGNRLNEREAHHWLGMSTNQKEAALVEHGRRSKKRTLTNPKDEAAHLDQKARGDLKRAEMARVAPKSVREPISITPLKEGDAEAAKAWLAIPPGEKEAAIRHFNEKRGNDFGARNAKDFVAIRDDAAKNILAKADKAESEGGMMSIMDHLHKAGVNPAHPRETDSKIIGFSFKERLGPKDITTAHEWLNLSPEQKRNMLQLFNSRQGQALDEKTLEHRIKLRDDAAKIIVGGVGGTPEPEKVRPLAEAEMMNHLQGAHLDQPLSKEVQAAQQWLKLGEMKNGKELAIRRNHKAMWQTAIPKDQVSGKIRNHDKLAEKILASHHATKSAGNEPVRLQNEDMLNRIRNAPLSRDIQPEDRQAAKQWQAFQPHEKEAVLRIQNAKESWIVQPDLSQQVKGYDALAHHMLRHENAKAATKSVGLHLPEQKLKGGTDRLYAIQGADIKNLQPHERQAAEEWKALKGEEKQGIIRHHYQHAWNMDPSPTDMSEELKFHDNKAAEILKAKPGLAERKKAERDARVRVVAKYMNKLDMSFGEPDRRDLASSWAHLGLDQKQEGVKAVMRSQGFIPAENDVRVNELVKKYDGFADRIRGVKKKANPKAQALLDEEFTPHNNLGKLTDSHLLSGEVSDLHPVSEQGINITYIGHHTVNGVDNTVIVKGRPTRGRAVRRGIPVGKDPERERAAVVVNRAMGDLVDTPNVVIRDSPVGEASVAEFAHNSRNGAEGMHRVPAVERHHAAVYDTVIGNLDRHRNNFRLKETTDGHTHLLLIDHGLAFPDEKHKDGWANGFGNWKIMQDQRDLPLRSEETQALENMVINREQITKDLHPLLPQENIDGMFGRVDWLLEHNRIPEDFGAMA